MKNQLKLLTWSMVGAGLVSLAGCGGGGTEVAPQVVPQTTDVPVTVIDGAIEKAKVCLDKNSNGACDDGETFGITAANGTVVLKVPKDDVGKYSVLAEVGTNATDADHGPVTTAFTLKAPADQAGVVSPLTTLVQQTAETSQLSTALAIAQLKEQTGIANPMADYTQGSTADASASAIARSLVVVAQDRAQALASTVGIAAAGGGGNITRADLDKAIQAALLQILPQLVAAASSTEVQAACSSSIKAPACATAIAAKLPELASQTGLTPDTLPIKVGLDRSLANPQVEATTPVAAASLDWLRYTDANNWYYRAYVSTVAETTPDAKGLTRYRDQRVRKTAGTAVTWAFSGDYARRDDVHFNGSAWVGCTTSTQSTQTVPNAQGRNETWYCDNYQRNKHQRTFVDVSGQTLASVVTTIRAQPYPYGSLSYSNWGTSEADGLDQLVLGTATFPAGSQLSYRTSTTLETAMGYDIRPSNEIAGYSAAVAAGGDARTSSTHACNSAEAQVAPTLPITSLEGLVAAFKGTPCVFNQGTVTANGVTFTGDNPNEWWGQSTASVGTVGNAPTTGTTLSAYYTTNQLIRLAFTGAAGAKEVTYYQCKQRILNGSPRQCKAIGKGTYTLEAKGDGRVMTLSNPPLQAAPLTYSRVFVERAGKVYWGYQDKPVVFHRARLNLTATNALFQQLGMPSVQP